MNLHEQQDHQTHNMFEEEQIILYVYNEIYGFSFFFSYYHVIGEKGKGNKRNFQF